MPVAVCLLLALSLGCGRWETCAERATWELAFSEAAQWADIRVTGGLVRRTDGDLIIATTNSGALTLGDRALSGPHLARISADGKVLAAVHVPEILDPLHQLQLDDAGNIVLAARVPPDDAVTIIAFDAELQRRWDHPLGRVSFKLALDVDANGLTAFSPLGTTTTNGIHLLEPSGTSRWVNPNFGVESIHFASDGTIHGFIATFPTAQRTRFALADGTTVDVMQVPRMPSSLDADGSFLHFDYSGHAVERFDAAGQLQWRREFVFSPRGGPFFEHFGDVVLVNILGEDEHDELVRLDAGTGVTIGQMSLCGDMRIMAADETGFVAVESEVGIARFAFE